MIRLLAFFFLSFFSFQLYATSFPGGLAFIEIREEKKPEVFFQNNRVMLLGKRGNWRAVVGIDLSIEPGEYFIEVKNQTGIAKKPFFVEAKEYESQYITIKDKRKVNPNKLDMQRINKDSLAINKARASWSDNDKPVLQFKLPLEGRISSPFGLRRFFNQQARKPHSGLDIAAPLGTPVKAAGKGLVVATGDYFFNGRTVFLDHGQGLLTMYCHLNEISVSVNQKVEQGDILGEVGKSGRVTGAHLHWSVMLNKTMVDPLLFTKD